MKQHLDQERLPLCPKVPLPACEGAADGSASPCNWIGPVAYLLLFLVCVLSHGLPFVPLSGLEAIFSPDTVHTLQDVLLVTLDFVQDILWAPLRHVFEDAAFLAVRPLLSNLKDIRKSDALNAVVKSICLKFPAVGITLTMVLSSFGLTWAAPVLAAAVLLALGGINYALFTPLVEAIQECKSARDNAVYDYPTLPIVGLLTGLGWTICRLLTNRPAGRRLERRKTFCAGGGRCCSSLAQWRLY